MQARARAISHRSTRRSSATPTLRSAPTLPAIDRYTGVLYDALDVGSLTRRRRRPCASPACGRLGALRAPARRRPVPAYRLSATSKLPGRPALATRWRPLLEPVLAADRGNASWSSTCGRGRTRRSAGCPTPFAVEVVSERADGTTHRRQSLQQGAQGATGPDPGRHQIRARRCGCGRDDRAPRRNARGTPWRSTDSRGARLMFADNHALRQRDSTVDASPALDRRDEVLV